MKINTSAVIKASLIGLIATILVGIFASPATSASTTGSAQGPNTTQLLISGLVEMGIGALNGYFALGAGTPVSTSGYAKGGAATAAITSLFGITFLVAFTLLGPRMPGDFVGSLLSVIGVGLLLNAALGAVGGALYASANRTQTTTPPAV